MPNLSCSISPEEVYRLETAAENVSLQQPLNQLYELGFTNFARNKELLVKFNLNLENVCACLIEDDQLY